LEHIVIEPTAELGLIALVTHARSVPSEEREAFGDAAAAVAHDPRTILLRTCHRAELYVATRSADGDARPTISLPRLPEGGRRLEDADVVRHLFTVAAGLDSVVVGEDQILHQLRDCLSDRHIPSASRCPVEIGTRDMDAIGLDPVLARLFQSAAHLGRETRSWREGPPRSLADVVLDRIVAVTGPVAGRSLLVVGAGRMARLVALAASQAGADVLVANRSPERAEALAHDAGGGVAAFGPGAPLPEVDAIVLAIAAPWPLSTSARADLLALDLPVVDLSSPPAIEPDLRAQLGARYTSVDDIARGPRDTVNMRTTRRFERAMAEADAAFGTWVQARTSVPTIQALSAIAEERRAEELDRLFRRMPLEDHERELVEQMSHRLVAGLLHAPLATLRADASGDAARAARVLFSL
jgi:glutamyl-tRNA reductase